MYRHVCIAVHHLTTLWWLNCVVTFNDIRNMSWNLKWFLCDSNCLQGSGHLGRVQGFNVSQRIGLQVPDRLRPPHRTADSWVQRLRRRSPRPPELRPFRHPQRSLSLWWSVKCKAVSVSSPVLYIAMYIHHNYAIVVILCNNVYIYIYIYTCMHISYFNLLDILTFLHKATCVPCIYVYSISKKNLFWHLFTISLW